MAKLVVMTDLHLKAGGGTIIGLDPLARFEMALGHAAEAHADADGLLLMGDLTHSGRREEYALLRGLLADLPWPVTLMLGNHDQRDVFCRQFPEVPLSAGGFVESVLDLGARDRVITLDTLDGPPFRSDHHSGRLCDQRMGFLREALQTDRRVTVALHHPPTPVGFPAMDGLRLVEGAALLDVLNASGQVAMILAGHVHRTIALSVSGLAMTVFKSPCHQMPMDLTGRDPTASTDEPGAYGLVLFEPWGIAAHTVDFTLQDVRVVTGSEALPDR